MIIASAIRHKHITFTGFRHSDIISYLVKLGVDSPIDGEHGFVTHKGEFLTRSEAKHHALDCGQIEKAKEHPMTSGDLW